MPNLTCQTQFLVARGYWVTIALNIVYCVKMGYKRCYKKELILHKLCDYLSISETLQCHIFVFIFSSTHVLTSSYRRSLYTFYKHHSISNHCQLDCLFNLYLGWHGRKPYVTGPLWGESAIDWPVTQKPFLHFKKKKKKKKTFSPFHDIFMMSCKLLQKKWFQYFSMYIISRA